MSVATIATPSCPRGHGLMGLRDVTDATRNVTWCGTWFDCTQCASSALIPSPALTRFLGKQQPADVTVVDTREQDAVAVPQPPQPAPEVRTGHDDGGYRVMHAPPGATLQGAREWLRDNYRDEGARCPACKQIVREYRRTIHAAMAEKLIQFWRTYGTMNWGERTPLMLKGRAGAADGGGDFAKLRYWGLIEESNDERQDGGRAGWWRVTQVGALFVQNQQAVPRYAYVYDGVCRRVDGPRWNIVRCLGKHFNYNELMGYAI